MLKSKKHKEKYFSKIFFFNFICMLTISYISFKKNHSSLLLGLDGSYMMDIVRQQLNFGLYSWFGCTNNIFQSLGNIYFPLNTNLIPGYAISAILNNNEINKTLTYLIFSSEIFLVIYLFCRSFNFKSSVAIIASWLFLLFSFPYIDLPLLYPIFSLVPHFCTGIAATYLIMILVKNIGKSTRIKSIFIGMLISILILYVSVFCSTLITLMVPLLFFFSIISFVSLQSYRERMNYIYTFFSIACFLLFSGFFPYMLGLLMHTAGIFFSKELYDRKTMEFVSILLTKNSGGTVLFWLGFVGAIFDIIQQKGTRKSLSITFMCLVALIIGVGTCFVYFQIWISGPQIIYFEFFLWPLYAIYASSLLVFMYQTLCQHLIKFNILKKYMFSIKPLYIFPLIICIGYFMYFTGYKYSDYKFFYPPKKTKLIDYVKDEIALEANSEFKGRIATFDGVNEDKVTWFNLPKFNAYAEGDYYLLNFSYNNIPAFFEYNSLISPVFFSFIKKFLTYPQDKQTRNVIVTRKINTNILRLLGVKFILTDKPVDIDGNFLIKNVNPSAFLYELEDVNLGTYSPTSLIQISDANLAMKKMEKPDFYFKKEAIVHKNIEESLVSSEDTKINIEKNGYIHIVAKSSGRSLIVLPIEYSHCLKIIGDKKQQNVKIIRVNVLLTGLIFTKKLDVHLKYYTGLGKNSCCRISDYREAKKMNIG